MLKYITEKLIGQILPSVVATVLGAYVVNQYITRPNPPAATQAEAAKPASGAETPALNGTTLQADNGQHLVPLARDVMFAVDQGLAPGAAP